MLSLGGHFCMAPVKIDRVGHRAQRVNEEIMGLFMAALFWRSITFNYYELSERN